MNEEIPKDAPRYSIPKTLKVYKKVLRLLKELGLHDIGVYMGGPELAIEQIGATIEHRVVAHRQDTPRAFPYNGESRHEETISLINFLANRKKAVNSMLNQYVESEVTLDLLKDIALHVSGNLKQLRESRPFVRWDGTGDIWAPLQVKDCHRIPSKRKRMYVFRVKSYAGPTTACTWESVASAGRLRQMIISAGGLKYQRYAPEDISGLWFMAQLHNGKMGLEYDNIFITSSMRYRNKELMKARSEKCAGPYVPARGRKCTMCPAGRDICRNARLEKTWVKRTCANGHEGFFDPDNTELEYCMSCVTTGAWFKQRS